MKYVHDFHYVGQDSYWGYEYPTFICRKCGAVKRIFEDGEEVIDTVGIDRERLNKCVVSMGEENFNPL